MDKKTLKIHKDPPKYIPREDDEALDLLIDKTYRKLDDAFADFEKEFARMRGRHYEQTGEIYYESDIDVFLSRKLALLRSISCISANCEMMYPIPKKES